MDLILTSLKNVSLINGFDPIDLLSVVHDFTLSVGSSMQTAKVCV